MSKTIYIDLNKVESVDDLKLIIRLQIGLSAYPLGLFEQWKMPKVVIKGKESVQDIINSMDHLIDHDYVEDSK